MMTITSPWDGREVGEVPRGTGADVDKACAIAAQALKHGDLAAHQRANILDKAAVLVRNRRKQIGSLLVAEAGKPVRDAQLEIDRCIQVLKFSAVEARTLSGDVVPLDASGPSGNRLAFTIRVPLGVVAAITPFNFPLNLVAHKVAPAIAAGCPVVLKPADRTPLTAMALAACLIDAGLPTDWLQVITGTGPEVGAPLAAHPVPAVVSFTGSVGVGRAIAQQGPHKKVLLELGSNAPVIVQGGVDLDRAADRIVAGGFAFAGQSCISTQRVLVHETAHDELVAKLKRRAERLVVGDPADESTDVGPLISREEAARVESWIAEAVAEGARLVCGGQRLGTTVTPTILDTPNRSSKVYGAEVFGPVLTVTTFRTFDEAIELANDNAFGLHAGVFTNSFDEALTAVRELGYGGVLINEVPTYRADHQPYGGHKDSGNTKEGPAYTVRELTDERFVLFSA